MNDQQSKSFRIIFVGDEKSGKSSIIRAYINEEIPLNKKPSIF